MLQIMRREKTNMRDQDVTAVADKLVVPQRPASLRMAETRLRELRNEHAAANSAHSQTSLKDWSAGLQQPSDLAKQLGIEAEALAAQVRAARAELTEERRAYEPKFLDAMSLPVAAAVDLIASDLVRLDLLASRLLDLHVSASHLGMQSPFDRAPDLVNAVRSLRLAISPRSA